MRLDIIFNFFCAGQIADNKMRRRSQMIMSAEGRPQFVSITFQ